MTNMPANMAANQKKSADTKQKPTAVTMTAIEQLLTEQLSSHIDPIKTQLNSVLQSLSLAHDEIASLKDRVRVLGETEKKVDLISARMSELANENKALKDHILNIEYQSRRDNLQFMDIQERRDENPERVILQILDRAGIVMCGRDIVRAHRLGPYRARYTRPIIVKFAHYKDREIVWAMRYELLQQSHIHVVEDWPQEMAERRRMLLPIFHAARNERNEAGQPRNRVKLVKDKLIINGSIVTPDTTHRLPEHLQLRHIFTPSRGDMVAFFTAHSPLSNHFLSTFDLDGHSFNCNEQFIMYQKATFFNDMDTATRILAEVDPKKQKGLGREVAGFSAAEGDREVEDVLLRGLRAKFHQSEDCAAFLKATREKILVEGNPRDTQYGVGLSIFNHDIWDPTKHKGRNLMGKCLMTIRSEL